jgi:hypothetical protein
MIKTFYINFMHLILEGKKLLPKKKKKKKPMGKVTSHYAMN